jgi:hypothetical protein
VSHVIVNLGLTWQSVGAIPTGGGNHVRDAFLNGSADKVLLPAGTVLYKFNAFSTLHGPDPAAQFRPISPWWSPYHPFRHDPGWEAKKRIAAHLGVSVREWGRVTSAVKENWNSLQHLLVITLKHNVYAFFGGFAQQQRMDPGAASTRVTRSDVGGFVPEGRGRTRNLPGGGTQFYIPNLRPANISKWHTESLLTL